MQKPLLFIWSILLVKPQLDHPQQLGCDNGRCQCVLLFSATTIMTHLNIYRQLLGFIPMELFKYTQYILSLMLLLLTVTLFLFHSYIFISSS